MNKPSIKSAVIFIALVLLVLWSIEWGIQLTDNRVFVSKIFGLMPHYWGQWWAMFSFVWIHSGTQHLLSNSIGLASLLFISLYFYNNSIRLALPLMYLLNGLGVWLLGSAGSVHIGASGLVYGLAGFLVMSALVRKDRNALALAFLVIVTNEGLFWSLLRKETGISYEAHLVGALSGFLCAILLKDQKEFALNRPMKSTLPSIPKTLFFAPDTFTKTLKERELEALLLAHQHPPLFPGYQQISQNLDQAEMLLEAGQLVAIPTETVYGLAGNGLNPEAIARIFEAKNRPYFDPLILHTNSLEKVKRLVMIFPPKAELLARHFWPGPLTLLLPKRSVVPDLVTSNSPLVAVRIPSHPMTLDLLSRLPFPLAAPSANPFGYISPTRAVHVQQQLGQMVPLILDGGPCEVGVESTIVAIDEHDNATVLRKGGLSIEAIEQVIGRVQVQEHSSSNPQAPGMLKSHYAPRVPLMLCDIAETLKNIEVGRVAVLSYNRRFDNVAPTHQVVLTDSNSLTQAASRLFSAMRYLDSLDVDLILAELVPNEGLGLAINDRLTRAAAK